MTDFILRKRPKKPERPRSISKEIGAWVSFNELAEQVVKFVEETDDIDISDVNLEVAQALCEESVIFIEADPVPKSTYAAREIQYKADLKEYEEWRKKNKKKIEERKAEQKITVRKRKLERSLERLKKETEEVQNKLSKA